MVPELERYTLYMEPGWDVIRNTERRRIEKWDDGELYEVVPLVAVRKLEVGLDGIRPSRQHTRGLRT